jgi:hypothetical protein
MLVNSVFMVGVLLSWRPGGVPGRLDDLFEIQFER